MTPALQVWSSCTTIFSGGLNQLPAALSGRPMLLIADERLGAQIDAVLTRVPAVGRVLLPAGGFDDIAGSVADAMARHPNAVPVALGGGSVMDIVRLAALAAADPAADGLREAPDGPTFLPSNAVNPTICIPTTVGTAAEVSAVAVRSSRAGTAMIISPGLRSAGAVIDPILTETLPLAALAAGLVEPWARVCVPAIAGHRLRFQDGLANGVAATILGLGDELSDNPGSTPDDDWRSSAALVSIQTHLALLALGRAPAGHVLWPLATEVVRATGLPKSTALAALVPAWLRCIAAGATGRGWGSADRVHSILGLDPAEAADRMQSWLQGLALPTLLPAGMDVDAVVTRVLNPWQASGYFLTGIGPDEIAVLVGVATQPGTPAEST